MPFFKTLQKETDANDAPFLPEVDLSNKPWFDVVSPEPPPVVEVAARENLNVALNSVPVSTQRQMGHKVEDLIQECSFDGELCNPGYGVKF